MNAVLRVEDWADNHHPAWIDFLRIVLGVILIIKGIFLFEHSIDITNFVLTHRLEYLDFMAAQYTVLVTIGGGLLIASGLLTRFASLLNLPIFIADVFFLELPASFSIFNTNQIISLAVLILLVVFLIFGSGKFSFDKYAKVHDDI